MHLPWWWGSRGIDIKYLSGRLVWIITLALSFGCLRHLCQLITTPFCQKSMCAAGLNCSPKNTASSVYICLPYSSSPALKGMSNYACLHRCMEISRLLWVQNRWYMLLQTLAQTLAPMLTQGWHYHLLVISALRASNSELFLEAVQASVSQRKWRRLTHKISQGLLAGDMNDHECVCSTFKARCIRHL